eukprot:jgi/Mesvir1/25569/Mv01802-RA.2
MHGTNDDDLNLGTGALAPRLSSARRSGGTDNAMDTAGDDHDDDNVGREGIHDTAARRNAYGRIDERDGKGTVDGNDADDDDADVSDGDDVSDPDDEDSDAGPQSRVEGSGADMGAGKGEGNLSGEDPYLERAQRVADRAARQAMWEGLEQARLAALKAKAPLMSAEELPSTETLELRVDGGFLRDTLFVHKENLARLAWGSQASSLDLANVRTELPSNGAEALAGLHWEDCAVVGSGGGLGQSRLGTTIDKHQMVLRINQAPTKGFEAHVGSKTHARLINTYWTKNYSSGKKGYPLERNLLLISSRAEPEDFSRLVSLVRVRRPDVRLRLLSSRVVTTVRQGVLQPYRQHMVATGCARRPDECRRWNATEPLLRAVNEGRDTPSSGLLAVFLLCQLCDRVSVYGFSGMNDSKAGYHYWRSSRFYMNRTHSFSAERALFRALARDGRITFVEGNLRYVQSGVR